MGLKERIESDFKSALKAGDAVRLSCLRMIKAAVFSKEIEEKCKNLEDSGIISVLNTLVKRANESISQFELGGRSDLSNKEKAELEIIKAYLPAALSESEIAALVDSAVLEACALGPKDMGKVMKILAPKISGRADGKIVSTLVQKKLQKV
ncbi:MAG: GatB/YqeY domain-containing protein [Deltaproteobacteria bacterium]|nr:GatB/YqeY domain-containing protein [Deltaproteobacteria bacterium]